ncbi:hypothetical protein JCM10207_000473 [Rhodosporidiobolus poonsookiae]
MSSDPPSYHYPPAQTTASWSPASGSNSSLGQPLRPHPATAGAQAYLQQSPTQPNHDYGRPSSSSAAMNDYSSPRQPHLPRSAQGAGAGMHAQANGVALPAVSTLQPAYQGMATTVWRDDGRRKSLKLDSGSLVGSAKATSAWDHGASVNDAALRRASWAGHSAQSSYDDHHRLQTLPESAPNGYGHAAAPSSSDAPMWAGQYSTGFPGSMQQMHMSTSDAGSGAYSATAPHPAYAHPAYLTNPAPGVSGYAPYTPASSTFPATVYTPFLQQPSPAPSTLGGSSSAAVPSAAYSHSAYLPAQRTSVSYPAPSTVPPQATLASYLPASPVSPTFPVDASSPYIPSNTAAPAQVVLTATAARQKLGKIDLTGHSKQDPLARRPPTTAVSTRRAVELVYNCQHCSRKVGTITLRGGAVEKSSGDNASKYLGVFYCSNCSQIPPPSSSGSGTGAPPHPANVYAGEASYYDTLTAAVDAHLGEDVRAGDTRPPPVAPGKTRSGFTPLASMTSTGKKRRSSVVDTAEGILACDVCRRDLATGTLQIAATGEPIGATIEVLCAHCETRYMRCSDCGGGGGQKGVGRWRSKEVFTNGRKTCMLSHTRIGTVNEMDYDIYTISSLSRNDILELVDHCRDLYYTTLLGTLAVPDMLESACPIARSYSEVEKLCVDSWTTYEPLLTQDIEAGSGIRRYVAVRWARPTTRKKRNKKSGSGSGDTQASPENPGIPLPRLSGDGPLTASPIPTGQPVIREGKILTGFVLAEHDLNAGILHVALTLPTGAGESYDASTRLLQTLVARVHEDLNGTNAHRAHMGLPAYPMVSTAWQMHMTKRDSRIMSRLETRRGFIPLEDFLVKYEDVDASNFPPHRPTYLPNELLRGWTVYAKRLTSDDLPPSAAAATSASRPATSAGTSTSSTAPQQLSSANRRASVQ